MLEYSLMSLLSVLGIEMVFRCHSLGIFFPCVSDYCTARLSPKLKGTKWGLSVPHLPFPFLCRFAECREGYGQCSSQLAPSGTAHAWPSKYRMWSQLFHPHTDGTWMCCWHSLFWKKFLILLKKNPKKQREKTPNQTKKKNPKSKTKSQNKKIPQTNKPNTVRAEKKKLEKT